MVRLISRDPIMNLIVGLFTLGVVSTTVCDRPRVTEQVVSPNNLEVQISQDELEPWRIQYLEDNRLDADELRSMANYVFWENAYNFFPGDPHYRPREGIDYTLNSCNLYARGGPEAMFSYFGNNYRFKVQKDLKGASISYSGNK